jgi:hypothetical protein
VLLFFLTRFVKNKEKNSLIVQLEIKIEHLMKWNLVLLPKLKFLVYMKICNANIINAGKDTNVMP